MPENNREALHHWILQKQQEYQKEHGLTNIIPRFCFDAITDALDEGKISRTQDTFVALSCGWWVGYLYGKYPEEMTRVYEIGER